MLKYIRQSWLHSKLYRVFLILAIIWVTLRLLTHVALVGGLLLPGEGGGISIPNDLNDYLTGAAHFQQQEPLYATGKLEHVEFYQYSPAYALVFSIFLGWSPLALVTFHTLLHLAAYGLLFLWWGRIFERLKLERAREMLAWTLPVWLVFSAFWSDLGYLNIYLLVALLATFLIEGVLFERWGWSLLWLSIILQIKPQWAFALLVPLFLGRFRFFFKLLIGAIVTYAAIVGVTLLIAGPQYGAQQYLDYARFLLNMSSNFPWRGPAAGFLGYNHSIMQIVLYFFGVTPENERLATLIKVVLLIPLAAVCVRYLLRPARRPGYEVPIVGLDLAFALYLGAFIWLDVVWELSLGIALFTYVLATAQRRGARIASWIVFLPYALVDLWQVISYVVLGDQVLLPGQYIGTDPTIYFPLIMVVILAFYVLLLGRLWPAARAAVSAPQPAPVG